MNQRETITADEAAEILGLSAWTVYDLARRRVLPHARVGRRVLFRRSSILAWLEQQEAMSMQLPGTTTEKIRVLKA